MDGDCQACAFRSGRDSEGGRNGAHWDCGGNAEISMLDDAGVGLELDVQVTVVESNLSLGGAIIRSISQSPMLCGLRKFLVIAGTS